MDLSPSVRCANFGEAMMDYLSGEISEAIAPGQHEQAPVGVLEWIAAIAPRLQTQARGDPLRTGPRPQN